MSELELRAADADRERTAERLRAAAAEGRLSPDELEERLEVALAARTYAQLEAAVADLPAAEPPAATPARAADPERRAFLLTSLLLVAIWALTGAGYFWPVWPILGWGVFVVVPSRWLGCAPCRRNASSRL
jgi:hypothetical protein